MMDRVQCLLSCGCWVRVALRIVKATRAGLCPLHGARRVQSYNAHEWHVRCFGGNAPCRYSRWMAQDETRARRAYAAHVRLNPDHAAAVAYDGVTLDGKGTMLRGDGPNKLADRIRRRVVQDATLDLSSSEDDEPAPF